MMSLRPQSGEGGELLLDRAGLVLAADEAAARLLGRPVDQIVGRGFFSDIAPGTRYPGFYGRFLRAVREQTDIALSASFTDGEWTVRTSVAVRPESATVRLNINVEEVEKSTAGLARTIIWQRANAESVDAEICAQEPVHTPGSIQSNAGLLIVDSASETIQFCSDNIATVLGIPPEKLLGAWIESVLPPGVFPTIRASLRDDARYTGRIALFDTSRQYDVQAHRSGGDLMIEFEDAPDHKDFPGSGAPELQRAVRALRQAKTLADLAQCCAREARLMTCFERVLVYRFDANWNGEVIGEDLEPHTLDSLLGIHFPASDIPAQARSLYQHAPSRFVLDRDAVPSPLMRAPASGDNRPVDLSLAQFRSLSPIHLEYQRNLGVNGSMSVSLIVGGRLWGLLIGHHRMPHYVPSDSRRAVETLADMFALRAEDMALSSDLVRQYRGLAVQTELLQHMAQSDDFVAALTGWHVNLLDLFGASGAFVVRGSEITGVGRLPPTDALQDLVAWLRLQPSGTIETRTLAALYPPAAQFDGIGSGMLAAFVDAAREHILVWLRPERVHTVTWGGDPHKAVRAGDGTAAVLPRRSFERWVEEQRGQSEPWAEWQIRIAETLAVSLEGVILHQQRRIAALSATERDLNIALAQKDLLSREIDHRVKNSLQIVASFLQLQSRTTTDPQAREAFSDTYARVMSVARVHDTLYQSEHVEEVDLGQTIARLCDDLSEMAGQDQEVAIEVPSGVMIPYRTAVAVALIATELVTNAFKHGARGEQANRVSVSLRNSADGIRLSVCDNGEGLPPDWADQPHQGLGMRLIRAMLQQVGGRLETENANGACFHVFV
jgi:two-component system, chemotaxis family, sensor kinase Cph1